MHLPHVLKSPDTRFARWFRQMPRLKEATALLVCLWTTLPAVHAAEKAKNPPVSIYCSAYADGLKSVFFKNRADAYQDIGLSTANVLDAQDPLVEDGRILLYGPAGEDGKHPVVATVEIGAIRQPLIILYPAAEGGDQPYAAKAVEADSAVFPPGSFKLVNLSPNPVRVSHGEKVIELENAGDQVFKPEVPAGESLAVTVDFKSGENWALLSSARWAARNDRRTLVCFQLDPVSKRMVVKSVPLRESPAR